jgi:NTP pyrophosphatase (non-canonical NTP hydrolase)
MPTKIDTIRPEVLAFMEEMEARLRANDHKGGWEDCSYPYLIRRIREETDELLSSLGQVGVVDPAEVRREAADVANFAMMVADVFGRKSVSQT